MKKAAIIMYVLYATALVLALTFGREASQRVITWFETELNKKEIKSVTVNIDDDTELLAGREHQPQYTAKGKFRGDPGLVFTSLTPDYLEVSESGALYANMNFAGDVLDASIKVTSVYDESFEETFSFRFVKKYPESFKVSYSMSGYSNDADVLYVGVPVYVHSVVTSDSVYNVTSFEITYDEEYFERASDGGLIPLKTTSPGEALDFVITYANGATAKSKSFGIAELEPVVIEVDEIRINDTSLDEFEASSKDIFVITFYYNGEKVDTDYTLDFSADSGASGGAGGFYFRTSGDKTVTVTAANGFSKTVSVKVRNIIGEPRLVDSELEESKYISLLDTDVKHFSYTFDEDVTYESVKYKYDSDIIQVSADSRSFTITPVSVGTTTLTLIIDDGFSRIERTYTVEVKEDTRVGTVILENILTFVPKVMGHALMFAVLAMFAMNMFKYCGVQNLLIRFPLYTLTGLPIAALTEFIQMFMPLRTASVGDIIIDMSGFYIGTLVIVILRIVFKIIFKLIRTVLPARS